MTKQDFLDRLRRGMFGVPESRVREIEEDIHRHFEEGLLSGLPEDELASMLGDPDELAREYSELYGGVVPGAPEPAYWEDPDPVPVAPGAAKVAMSSLALFLLTVLVALPVALVLIVLWAALVVCALTAAVGVAALFLTFVSLIVGPFPYLNSPFIMNLMGSIGAIGFGGLSALALEWYTKKLIAWGKRYLTFLLTGIRGRRTNHV